MKLRAVLVACLFGAALALSFFLCELNTRPSTASSPSSAPLQRFRGRRDMDSYYDFLINEWSFKFWAVFQLVTIAVLLYSTFAAIYYAKYTYLHTPPTDDDLWRRRALTAVNRPPHTPGITA